MIIVFFPLSFWNGLPPITSCILVFI